jgi:ATP-binding protein involved in chromosome partitioning
MASKALQKITHDTNWHDLDVLIVDLPPGTGDIQLTLCQKLPVTGAVVVTTPQDLALIDVDRAIGMFNKVSLPVLGIIENMSVFTCPHCHTDTHIFGQGGGAKMQAKFEVPLLGQIPLIPSIQEDMDAGMPTVAKDADSTEAKIYIEIARGMLTELAKRPKGFKAVMPKVVVEN